ncbi:MAG: 7-cyano-7-deazaguanine synthase [Desulfomonilaceae bacterium]
MSSQPMFSESACEEFRPGRKAVALLSGGLDSALAIYLVKRQGIDVIAVHFTSFFSQLDAGDDDSPLRRLARQLNVPLRLLHKGKDFLKLLRNPRYGYGKNLNPCIDCRIYTFVKAKELMEEIGASFLITGEVVGQRPMSQRRNAIRLIEKRSGCDGLVLRPLSAKLLPETRAEETGAVDREQLLDVAGRGRKVQLRLAAEFGLSGYSPPAGGCLLTDKKFSSRVRDLLAHADEVSPEDLELLHLGRHIRIRPGLKIVIGRNEAENQRIERLAAVGSLFSPVNFPGPLILAVGRVEPDDEALIGSVLRRYAKESSRGEWISLMLDKGGERRIRVTDQAGQDWISDHMI